MDTFFELIDVESGNVLKDSDTEAEAFGSLTSVLLEHGEEALEGLALLQFVGDDPTLIAIEDELVARIRSVVGGEDAPSVVGLRSNG